MKVEVYGKECKLVTAQHCMLATSFNLIVVTHDMTSHR